MGRAGGDRKWMLLYSIGMNACWGWQPGLWEKRGGWAQSEAQFLDGGKAEEDEVLGPRAKGDTSD